MRFSRSGPPSGGTPDLAADAIVVLGCRLRSGGLPSRAMRRRVALGAALYARGAAPVLLMAGGCPPRCELQTTEAQAMRDLAVAAGIPEAAVLMEACSRNTAENALCSARLLRRQGMRRIVLVSHRAHLFRAALLFRLAGLTVVHQVGAPSRSRIAGLAARLREAAALPRSIVRVLIGREG